MWSVAVAILVAGLWPPDVGEPARNGWDSTLQDQATNARAGRDPGARVAAIVRMGTAQRAPDLRRIATFLDSADPSIRLAAARMLARAGDPDTLARVASQAAGEDAPQRFEALTVLRETAVLPASARRAAERALVDSDPGTRLVALDVLALHPSVDSVTSVAGSLTDGNRDVRLAAIALLGRTPDPRALMPLLEHTDTSDRTERIAVLQALGGFAHVHPRLEAGPVVLRQVNDVNEDVRTAAIDALGRLRWAPAVPVLRAIAARPAGTGLARRATLALGEIGDAAAVDALVELLREPAPPDEVLVALRRAGRAAVKPVTAILGSAFTTTEIAAVSLLGELSDLEATPALVRALQTRPGVAISAARTLGRLRDGAALPALIASVTAAPYAKAAGVRTACLQALAAIGDPRAAGVVEVAAGDDDPGVRAAALDLAATIHAGLSQQTLVARLRDGDAVVRIAAIRATAAFPKMETGALLPRALAGLAKVDATTRARVCAALARTRLPTADAQLVAFLDEDPDEGVRAAAAWAARSRRKIPTVATALGRARDGGVAAVAANAAAALNDPRPDLDQPAADHRSAAAPPVRSAAAPPVRTAAAPPVWVGVSLVAPDGDPIVDKWLRVHAGGRLVWIRTDDRGQALLLDPPPGPYRLSLDPDDHEALTAATASGRSPASTPVGP